MLENLRNKNAVILGLLAHGKCEAFWTVHGPTQEALQRRDDANDASSARTWVRLAFSLYDGSGGLQVAELMERLEQHELVIALSTLVRIGVGDVGVESVLSTSGQDPESGSQVH